MGSPVILNVGATYLSREELPHLQKVLKNQLNSQWKSTCIEPEHVNIDLSSCNNRRRSRSFF